MPEPAELRIPTPRLNLRDFVTEDLDAVHAFRSDPEVARYSEPLLENEGQTATWLDEVIIHNRQRPRSAYNLAITLKDTGQVMGWIGIGDSDRYPSKGELSFGYALNRAYWRKGYATEAASAIVDFGFSALGGTRVSAWCWEENVASARVLEKAGLRFVQRLEETDSASGTAIQGREYALRREEWRARDAERPEPAKE